MGVLGGFSAALVAHGGVMLARCIHVRMPKGFGYQVNILCFVIQPGSVCAAQLMGTHAFFQGNRQGAIFFDHFLYGALGDAFALQRKEQGVLILRRCRFHGFALLQIICQRVGHFLRIIENDLVAALAGNQYAVGLKIQIVDIDAHTFADADARAGDVQAVGAQALDEHADARAQKQHQNGVIPFAGMLVISLLGFG